MRSTLVKTVTIILTESCNLNCTYCYEDCKSVKKNNVDDAKKIIEYEFAHSGTYGHIIFELFGGEPFLEYSTMKEIVHFLRMSKFTIPYSVAITTNGTLIHGEIQNWIKDNSDILHITLSCDGNKQMHDMNRSNSFDSIDIDFFRTLKDPRVKMTVSQETLSQLAEGVIFLHKQGFSVDCNLAFGIKWTEKKYLKILSEQLKILIDYYLENPNIQPCSMLSMKIKNVVAEIKGFATKWCGTGIHMKTYDVHSDCYACQFFTPLSIGKEKALEAKSITIPREIPIELLNNFCQQCPCVNICPTCYGSNYLETGNVYHKSEDYCYMMKIIFLANSLFLWKKIQTGQCSFTNEEKLVQMRAIEIIQCHVREELAFLFSE